MKYIFTLDVDSDILWQQNKVTFQAYKRDKKLWGSIYFK